MIYRRRKECLYNNNNNINVRQYKIAQKYFQTYQTQKRKKKDN